MKTKQKVQHYYQMYLRTELPVFLDEDITG